MDKFTLFTVIYFLLGIITFPLLDSVLMADKFGVLILLAFVYMVVLGVWSLVASSNRQLLIFSLLYTFISGVVSYDADKNVFLPGRDPLILAALVTYIVFIMIWFGVKYLKKRFKK